ncbi:MAG: hypothetical protein RLY31_2857 [Bacteroidota bacterium]|jgi:metal-sulfur cluster biosynthetic enzyme
MCATTGEEMKYVVDMDIMRKIRKFGFIYSSDIEKK